MNSARRMAYVAAPFTIGNVAAWALYAQNWQGALFFAALGLIMACLADWSDPRAGVGR